MRTPIVTVTTALSLVLIGCSPGRTVVVRQPPPAPVPVPVPVTVMEPLEIDVARPHNGKVFVQTNRPAYVAIFEIVPDRGVALVYPQSARQRRFVVSGLREVPVWWQASRVTYNRGSSSRSHPERYIYAIASDEPLRIPDAAFHGDGSLDEMIGNRAYRARNPYATMRALAREFVPSIADEAWAEDVHSLSPSYATERYRVARVYCGGGTVYEVPAELADRVWCPPPRGGARGPGRFSDDVDLPGSRRPLVRPDSMVGDNGRRVAMRPHGSNGRGPVDRVKAPPGAENRGGGENENDDRPGRGNSPAKNHPDSRADDRPVQPNEERDDKPRSARGAGMKDAKPPRAHPTPIPTPVDRSEPADKHESAGKPKNTDGRESTPKSETAVQPERPPQAEGPARPEHSPKAEGHARPEHSPKPEGHTRTEHSSKPDGSAKPAADDESRPGPKAEPKPQSSGEKGGGEPKAQPSGEKASGEKGGESKKGRGQSDADEKPAGGKSKPAEAKPLTQNR